MATLTLRLAAAAATTGASPWPAVDSDLAPHPALKQGTLPNGLRYLVLPNAEPKGRVSARLVVAAGSVHEADDERGLAHFVEHMAFRGTRTHPADSLTAVLQRLGVGRGPDNTAFTSYDHTIYHLELPDAHEQTLREGLRVFREYAEELTFDEQLVALERGVVLAERATRNTPAARNGVANLMFLFPKSRQLYRQPIGLEVTIKRFTQEQCRSFYDAWYRPERLAVVLVGTIEPDAAVRLIEAEFASLAARAPPRPEPTDLVPATATSPDVDVYSEAALLGMTLTFEHPLATPRKRDSREARNKTLRRGLALAMFQNRLSKLTLDPASSFVSPQISQVAVVPGWLLIGLSVSGRVDDWKRVLSDVEQEHRRAFLHGFSDAEFAEMRQATITAAEQAMRTESTWSSNWLAGRLSECMVTGSVFVTSSTTSPEAIADLQRMTADQCKSEFRETWSVNAPHVFIAANPAFRIERKEIGAALNRSRKNDVTRTAEAPVSADFFYTNFGPAGRLVREEEVPDLDLRLAEFANGVRCNFKATPFEADTVDINVRVGMGKRLQLQDQPGLELLANGMLLAGGLGRHTIQELGRMLSATTVRLGFSVESDACVFSVHCARRDLLFALQVIAAFLTDAAYRPEAMRAAQASFGTMYQELMSSPGGPMAITVGRALAAGDRRFGTPSVDELGTRTLPEVKTWLEPQFRCGPIEMSVVGDVSWKETADATARTLGALPSREARREAPVEEKVRPPRPSIAPNVFALDIKVKQCAIAWYWPVPETTDVRHERRCNLLAALLADRLRIRLRDALGATYTPTAAYTFIQGFPGMNYLSCYAEVDPAKVDRAMQLIEREATELAWRGPGDDEFERIKATFVRAMTDNLRTNVYWGRTVLADAQEFPSRIAAARDRAADIAAVTKAELVPFAKFLEPGRSFRYVTVPTSPPVRPATNPPVNPSSIRPRTVRPK